MYVDELLLCTVLPEAHTHIRIILVVYETKNYKNPAGNTSSYSHVLIRVVIKSFPDSKWAALL